MSFDGRQRGRERPPSDNDPSTSSGEVFSDRALKTDKKQMYFM